MKMKYVSYEENGLKMFIIFNQIENHSAFKIFKPLSAGFVDIYTEGGEIKAYCSGKSTTLGLSSNSEDSELLTSQLRQTYY
jgi:hypothetical protein